MCASFSSISAAFSGERGGKQLHFTCDSNCQRWFAHRRLHPAGRSTRFLYAAAADAAVLLCLDLPHTRTSPNRPHAAIMLTLQRDHRVGSRVFTGRRSRRDARLQMAAARRSAPASAQRRLLQVGGHRTSSRPSPLTPSAPPWPPQQSHHM